MFPSFYSAFINLCGLLSRRPHRAVLNSYTPKLPSLRYLIEEGAVAVEAGEGGLGMNEFVIAVEEQV